jgi:hypothetical protein
MTPPRPGSHPPLARIASWRARLRPSGPRLALLLLVAVLHAGGSCNSTSLLQVTLNAVPEAMNDVQVVPPHGFTVDVTFTQPAEIQPDTVAVEINGLDGSVRDYSDDRVVLAPDGAVFLIPESEPLSPGSYWVAVTARNQAGNTVSAFHPFAVRDHPAAGPPLAGGQWVQLDFGADHDGNGEADFRQDLEAFGLHPTAGGTLGLQMLVWSISEVVARTAAFYSTPNPSGLPGGDAADVTFALNPNPSGPTTRVCVGGDDPTGGPSIGAVLYDPGNGNKAQVACDPVLPSGVFPRELMAYSAHGSFQTAFGPVLANPVGDDPLDPIVLGTGYDPGDPDQLARHGEIETAVEAFAQAVATILAHEVGHSLGLVPPGAPGGGLFGGGSGPALHHNQLPGGGNPTANQLMGAGSTFNFAELSGVGAALPVFRELNWAYLRGRLVLDPQVTGIFPAPELSYSSPNEISLSGPPLVPYVCHGKNFLPTPTIRLVGPIVLPLASPYWVDQSEVQASVSVFQLVPGLYDLEVINPDGQRVVVEDAVAVVP